MSSTLTVTNVVQRIRYPHLRMPCDWYASRVVHERTHSLFLPHSLIQLKSAINHAVRVCR